MVESQSNPPVIPRVRTSGTFLESGIKCSNIMSIIREKIHTRPLLKGRSALAIFHGILQPKKWSPGDDFSGVINITRANQFGDDFSRGRFLQRSAEVP